MENVSKALLIAGGILLSVLLLGLGVLGYTKIKSFKTTEAESVEKKQKEAFNAEYEAYNRQLLYGIDVITVVNKAIENNIKQGKKDGENEEVPWFINVVINTDTEFKTTIWEKNLKDKQSSKKEINEERYRNNGGNLNIVMDTFKGKKSIGNYVDNANENWIAEDDIIQFFEQDVKTIIDEDANSNYVFYIEPALVKFKSAIFICTNIEYNGDGRVSQITFKEK